MGEASDGKDGGKMRRSHQMNNNNTESLLFSESKNYGRRDNRHNDSLGAILDRVVSSPMPKNLHFQSVDGRGTPGKVGAADCLNYLMKKVREQEERERELRSEIEALKAANKVLRRENCNRDDMVKELKLRLLNCRCREKHGNVSQDDLCGKSEMSRLGVKQAAR